MTNCKGCPGEHEDVWDCGDCALEKLEEARNKQEQEV